MFPMKKEINLQDYEAMIFDFDGTLVDSLGLWHDIDVVYLKRFGLECPDNLSEEINGMSFTETAQYFKKRFSIPHDIERIKQDWVNLSHDYYMTTIPFKPRAKEFLEKISKKIPKIGIATSNQALMTEGFFKREGIDYIKAFSYSCDVEKGKPYPYVFLEAAKKLKANPKKTLAFEDTVEGVLAAKRAGMTVVAVKDNHSNNEEKLKELADYYIKDYSELIKLLEE